MKMKKMLALFLALSMAFALCACGGSDVAVSDEPEAPSNALVNDEGNVDTEGKTENTVVAGEPVDRDYEYGELVIGTTTGNGGFDRVGTHGMDKLYLVYQAWDTLFTIDPYTGECVPLMVDTYEWAEDKLSIKLTLKEGIVALDGEPITAEDVIWSMERNVLEGGPNSAYFQAYDFETTWANLESPDSLTFTLYYKYEFGPGINYLTYPIYPKDWGTEGAGAEDAAWWDSPNSTGPYECVENVDGSHTIFELRDNYYMDTTGYPEKLTFKIYTEKTALYIDYANGTLDVALGLASDDVENLMNGELDNTSYFVDLETNVYAISLAPYCEYFQDENVRLAIAHCLDMEQIRLAAFGLLGQEARSSLPKGVNYYTEVGTYEYNVELAKEYLSKSAWPNGFDLHFYTPASAVETAIADMMQFFLSQIGINLTFEASRTTVVEYYRPGLSPICIRSSMEGAPTCDPDQIYNTIGYQSSLQASVVSFDPESEFSTHLYGALNCADPEKRQELYTWVQQYLYDTAYQIPVAQTSYGYCFRNDYVVEIPSNLPSAPDMRYARLVDESVYYGE